MRNSVSPAFWIGLALASLGISLPARAGESPVLVELFTSQGCSSCPPAEDWLNGDGMTLFQKGKIIPLAFHVDYWDYLGWKDPFSSPQNTQLQKNYADLWNSRSIYTPQIVVQGKTGFVGSDDERARGEIQRAKGETFPLSLRVQSLPTAVQVTLSSFPSPKADIWVVLFQNGCVTKVERGENRGRTLIENFVVRQWERIDGDSQGNRTVRFQVPPEVEPKTLGVVAFLKDPSTFEVSSAKCIFPILPRPH